MGHAKRSKLNDYVRREIAIALDSPEEIVESAVIIYEVEPDEVEPLVNAALSAHRTACANWPEVTDCDRLDRAFAALDKSGVLARQNFTCCNNCGHTQLSDRMYDELERGRTLDGYVFYHQQDTDRAVAGGGLHLSYHSLTPLPDAVIAIGRRVVEALRAQGLVVTWDENPYNAIELPSFDWKRRGPPPSTKAPRDWSPESLLDRWCEALPGSAGAELAEALGELYGEAAIAAGCIDVAIALARAPFAIEPGLRDKPRNNALTRVALALSKSDVPPARVKALWQEAYAAAPLSRHGELIHLLVAGELADPELHAVARNRVMQTRRDICGAAAVAWYLVRAPAESVDETEHAAMLKSIRRTFESSREEFRYSDTEHAHLRIAVASALWVIHVRRGELDLARPARELVLEGLDSDGIRILPSFVQRALLAAAAEVGELAGWVSRWDELSLSAVSGEVLDALVRTGQIDTAVEVAGQPGRPTELFARLARLVPDDPRASMWIEQAATAESLMAIYKEEDLLSSEEFRDARLEFAALRGARDDRERARLEIAAISADIRAEFAASEARLLAHLEQVRDGARGPALPVDERWFSPEGTRSLEKALTKWAAASDRRQRLLTRRSAMMILEAAVAFAGRGELDRARELVARVEGAEPPGDPTVLFWMVAGPLISAWVAIGRLDDALAYAHKSGVLGCGVITPLVVRLMELGRSSEALEFLGPALDPPFNWRVLCHLAPAVLAVSSNARMCAAAMLQAWRRADTVLDTLVC
ncbi:hypothetical protein HPC49_17660 [Pyxidicoccus fallax]|uniref:DUF6891 domain-containing protein n=1 Tax=Pyxidicoccus fallax TaxID=394095 RepID=A0A848L6I4_9BACT|nr:hypothetical protein [Pyxidicoccus fallax]NMO14264.1 hypothetical protein [Pyxidicoccus fallax]NPC80039.1 hypothetical protein [Pyxidicoccus fallax]